MASMARTGIILFTLFYLLVSTGFSVNAHRYGKRIRFVPVDSQHEQKSPCGKKMRPGCCKDIHAYLKINDNQKMSSQVTLPSNNFFMTSSAFTLPASEKL